MNPSLRLYQNLTLLALHDSQGVFEGHYFEYGLAGAMLCELLFAGHIDISAGDEKLVSLRLTEPIDDELLDELKGMIEGATAKASINEWVVTAANMKDLAHRVADGLCEIGVLKKEERKVLWIFSRQIYPEINGTFEDRIRAEMAAVMFHEKKQPDFELAALISLANQTNVLRSNFAQVELEQHQARIDSIANGELLPVNATKAAIEAIQSAIMISTIVASTTAATIAATR
ncbi:MAG: GPP34 family phosphoprotein [Planctomycetota bacterium]